VTHTLNCKKHWVGPDSSVGLVENYSPEQAENYLKLPAENYSLVEA